MTLGFVTLGSLEIELIEVTRGRCGYNEFLEQRGEGMHHLLFDVDDLDATEAALAEAGIGVVMGASGRRPGTRWVIFETSRLLGWDIEVRNRLAGPARAKAIAVPHKQVDDSLFAQEPAVRLGSPVQIGVVTDDARRQAEVLQSLLGIGPFRLTDWPWVRPDMQGFFKGQPADFSMRMGFADLGNIQMELLEPLKGESVYTEFLARRGPGLHHLLFDVPDVDAKLAKLAERGIGVRMTGTGLREGTKWLYLDTEPLLGWPVELRTKLP
jgi:catechol 2,3-dioxygenase-like lactoylglutathione lyase family enzyme